MAINNVAYLNVNIKVVMAGWLIIHGAISMWRKWLCRTLNGMQYQYGNVNITSG